MNMDLSTQEYKDRLVSQSKALQEHLKHPTGTIYNFKHDSVDLQEHFLEHPSIANEWRVKSSDKVREIYDYIHQLVMSNEKINFPAAFVKLLEDYMVGSANNTTEASDLSISFVAQGNESVADPVHLGKY